MKNKKLYLQKREEHCNNSATDTFIHYNGCAFYPSYYMTNEDIKELKQEYNTIKNNNEIITLSSFDNRAVIIKNNNTYTLQSYYTPVCEIENGVFKKLWYGYSNTTLKHINAFREYLNLEPISKYDWIMME